MTKSHFLNGEDPRWSIGALSPSGARELFWERVHLLALLHKADHLWLGMALLTWTVQAMAPSWLALSTGHLISELQASPPPGNGILSSPLFWTSVSVGAALAVMGASSSLQTILEKFVAEQIDAKIRSDVRLIAGMDLPMATVENRDFHDDVIAACDPGGTSKNRTAGAASVGQATLVARMLGAFLAALIIATVSIPLALFLLAATLTSRALIRRQWIYLARLDETLSGSHTEREAIEGYLTKAQYAREVRVFGLSEWLIHRWKKLDAPRQAFAVEHEKIIRRQVITSAITFSIGVGGFIVPGLLASKGYLDLGEVSQSLVATMMLFSISFMGKEAFDIDYGSRAHAAYLRIIERKSTVDGAVQTPTPLKIQDGPPTIRLERASFVYPDSEKMVLNELNLVIAPGETLGIVGPNGAGKTTLTKLLTGLYEATSGSITYDGDLLPCQIAVLHQDFIRYPLSIRQNIALGHSGPVDDDAIIRCAEVAGVCQLMEASGLDLDSLLWSAEQERAELSGGQWQRIALARVLYAAQKGCRIVILDEPTAQLDVDAELRFHDEILSILRNVTVLLITHRLSTVRRADRLAFIDGGRIVELGSHNELIDNDGQYAKLFRLQANQAPAKEG